MSLDWAPVLHPEVKEEVPVGPVWPLGNPLQRHLPVLPCVEASPTSFLFPETEGRSLTQFLGVKPELLKKP